MYCVRSSTASASVPSEPACKTNSLRRSFIMAANAPSFLRGAAESSGSPSSPIVSIACQTVTFSARARATTRS